MSHEEVTVQTLNNSSCNPSRRHYEDTGRNVSLLLVVVNGSLQIRKHKPVYLAIYDCNLSIFFSRVSDNCDINQMTSTNIGIVFGPTLLKPA